MSLAEIKSEARKTAFAVRKVAHVSGAAIAPDAARNRFLDSIKLPPEATVSGYLPIRTEIDPRPLLIALLDMGHSVAVPVIAAKDQPLTFRAWTPDTALVDGPFGVPVPEHGDWLTPDVLIVPLLAFDRQGYRLGYGGGFYDRTLAALPGSTGIGFAYEAQAVPEVPREPTDMALSAIVTEAAVHHFGALR